jgi:hypothetical protein
VVAAPDGAPAFGLGGGGLAEAALPPAAEDGMEVLGEARLYFLTIESASSASMNARKRLLAVVIQLSVEAPREAVSKAARRLSVEGGGTPVPSASRL